MRNRIFQYSVAAVCLLTFYGCPMGWAETYSYEGKNPHDLYALYELLEARPEGLILVEDSLSLLNDVSEASNYVFVGNYAYFNEKSVTQLLDFVERGNT
ncbi:MAG: DUF4350 domain-containing protein, partial [Bacteroidota bacterium]